MTLHIDALKDVKPEDIEDLSGRFLPLFQDSQDSDTVKRINFKDSSLFVIAILEHESQVNYRSSFKMLQYIVLVLHDWEKEINKKEPGSSLKKDFGYPPVLPIIFYDGTDAWTAEMNFFNRTKMNTVFGKYIPKYEYELVNLNDYSEEEVKGFGDVLSFIMLLDKSRGSGEESLLKHLTPDYIEKLNLQIPDNMVKLLNDVVRVLLDKIGVDRHIVDRLTGYIEKGGGKEYKGMFEAFIESIIEEREEARKQGIALGQEQGREEGIALGQEYAYKEKLQVAARFKKLGVSLETIIQATGLTNEEIKELLLLAL